jgi:hypothetical protein
MLHPLQCQRVAVLWTTCKIVQRSGSVKCFANFVFFGLLGNSAIAFVANRPKLRGSVIGSEFEALPFSLSVELFLKLFAVWEHTRVGQAIRSRPPCNIIGLHDLRNV